MSNELIGALVAIFGGILVVFWRKNSVRAIIEQSRGRPLRVPPLWQERIVLVAGISVTCIGVAELILRMR